MKRRPPAIPSAWVISLALGSSSCRAVEHDPSTAQAPNAAPSAASTGAGGAAVAASSAPGAANAGATPTPAMTGQPAPPASPEDCKLHEREVNHEVMTAYFAMSSGGAFLSAFDASSRALEECPDSEALWYAFARMAELGFDRFPMQVAGVRVENMAEAAALARSRQPRSARVAVIDARTHGGLERARSALALDPSYAPGRVALAQALFEQQQVEEALPLSDAPNVPGAASLRARLLIARGNSGDAKLAERLARRELTASWDAPEPYDMQPVRCAAQEALGLALHALHARKAKEELGKAVECGSTRANELLRGAQ
jgi:hypothetical protein